MIECPYLIKKRIDDEIYYYCELDEGICAEEYECDRRPYAKD
ncbi:hypothetical protein LCGC14_2310500 [marine sediment metagenome]|uniref:Uncharacterized protein n=1 Tax=marine sediment metagenome TaxID=412755 RepID=A0A0F9CKT3_9ZZZZ